MSTRIIDGVRFTHQKETGHWVPEFGGRYVVTKDYATMEDEDHKDWCNAWSVLDTEDGTLMEIYCYLTEAARDVIRMVTK